MSRIVAPYGAWPSPITPELLAESGRRLADLCVDGDDVYWSESRPAEAGRYVIVRATAAGLEDVLPEPWSARTSAHEYGGGAFTVADGVVYFSNGTDGGLYRVTPGDEPQPLCTTEGLRFADMVVDAKLRRIVCVVEDHRGEETENRIAAVPLHGGEPVTLVEGHDFFSAPRLAPDGTYLAWLSWDHPCMPWDETVLWQASVHADGTLGHHRRVAGGKGEAIVCPAWSPDGVLHLISDRDGWWNLYAASSGADGGLRALAPMEAECAEPTWEFGLQSYAFLDGKRIALASVRSGQWSIHLVDRAGGAPRRLDLPFTQFGGVMRSTASGRLVLDAGSATRPMSFVSVDPSTGRSETLRPSMEIDIDPEYFSAGEPVTFPSGGTLAHAILYRPRNPEVDAPEGTLPPLVVRAHGGPTSAAITSLDLQVQFWTTRGFAFCDVDYRGSSGYGRDYRRALEGKWGIADVDDCLNAARFLAGRGDVEPQQMVIKGGSAGGFAALLAVCGHHTFAACCSYYGVADARALAEETHKFESRYLDGLIGPLPQAADVYRQRSALHRVHEISVPVLLLQGLDDKVVPPPQTEGMRDALRERDVPCGIIEFEGEGHGFRQATSIAASARAEEWFYRYVFGLPAGDRPEGLDFTA